MYAPDYRQVRENLLIEGLRDWIYLGEVHSDFVGPDSTEAPPLHKVQELTLNMIRELVSDGLFVLGMPSRTKDNPTGFTPWDLPLDVAMAKIEDAYVKHFDDPRNWTNVVWMNLTDKGEKLAIELYHADRRGP